MPNSFFDKLKKGMGIESPQEEEQEEKLEEKPRKTRRTTVSKTAEPKNKKPLMAEEAAREDNNEEPAPPKELKIEARPIEPKEEIKITKPKEQWTNGGAFDEPAGQLAIDVYQTETNLVIQSAIAGVRADNLEISMERDVVTIKGVREKPFKEEGDYFAQECYWGSFSRQIIMPVEVDPDRAEASMKEGILTIRIPKILRERKRTIKVRI